MSHSPGGFGGGDGGAERRERLGILATLRACYLPGPPLPGQCLFPSLTFPTTGLSGSYNGEMTMVLTF